MKKQWMTLFAALGLGLAAQSCTDEDKIVAALQGTSEQSEGEQVPFFLYQNYPNPFNPATIIQFRVGQDMDMDLKVYTEDWQEMQTLLDGRYVAGDYRVQFNATELPSGEYYYVLEGGGYTQIRKMKLVK
jgi:hypothetical protein